MEPDKPEKFAPLTVGRVSALEFTQISSPGNNSTTAEHDPVWYSETEQNNLFINLFDFNFVTTFCKGHNWQID